MSDPVPQILFNIMRVLHIFYYFFYDLSLLDITIMLSLFNCWKERCIWVFMNLIVRFERILFAEILYRVVCPNSDTLP